MFIDKNKIQDIFFDVLQKLTKYKNGQLFQCLNPQHLDKHPSMGVYKRNNVFYCHCFSCGVCYDTIALCSLYYKQNPKTPDLYQSIINDYPEVRKTDTNRAENTHGLRITPKGPDKWQAINKFVKQQSSNVPADVPQVTTHHSFEKTIENKIEASHQLLKKQPNNYFTNRGLPPQIIEKYRLGVCTDYNDLLPPEYRIDKSLSSLYTYIIPYNKNYFLARINKSDETIKNLPKYLKLKNTPASIFNIDHLEKAQNNEVIFICEGILDALSVEAVAQCIGIALTGLLINNFRNALGTYLQQIKKKNIAFCLALDNDKPGQETTEKLKQLLHDINILYWCNEPYVYKDYNQFLQQDKNNFTTYIARQILLTKQQNTRFLGQDLDIVNITDPLSKSFLLDIFAEECLIFFLLKEKKSTILQWCINHQITNTWMQKEHNQYIYEASTLCFLQTGIIDLFLIKKITSDLSQKNFDTIIDQYYEKADNYFHSIQNLEPIIIALKNRIIENIKLYRLYNTLQGATKHLQSKVNSTEIIQQLSNNLYQIQQEEEKLLNDSQNSQIKNEILEYFLSDGNLLPGYSTGFTELDQAIGGLQAENLVVLAGRTSMGKTSLGACIALNLMSYNGVKQTIKVQENSANTLFISLEMSLKELYTRAIINKLKMNVLQLTRNYKGKKEQLRQNIDKIIDSPTLFWVQIQAEINTIITTIRNFYIQKNIKIVIIDHLHCIKIGKSDFIVNRYLELSQITQRLKQLAVELKISIVLLAQLNRKTTTSTSWQPTLSDLRDSGSIEEFADVVLLLHREVYYTRRSDEYAQLSEPTQQQYDKQAELIIAKNRNGQLKTVKLKFLGEFYLFENYESETWVKLPNNFPTKKGIINRN